MIVGSVLNRKLQQMYSSNYKRGWLTSQTSFVEHDINGTVCPYVTIFPRRSLYRLVTRNKIRFRHAAFLHNFCKSHSQSEKTYQTIVRILFVGKSHFYFDTFSPICRDWMKFELNEIKRGTRLLGTLDISFEKGCVKYFFRDS